MTETQNNLRQWIETGKLLIASAEKMLAEEAKTIYPEGILSFIKPSGEIITGIAKDKELYQYFVSLS